MTPREKADAVLRGEGRAVAGGPGYFTIMGVGCDGDSRQQWASTAVAAKSAAQAMQRKLNPCSFSAFVKVEQTIDYSGFQTRTVKMWRGSGYRGGRGSTWWRPWRLGHTQPGLAGRR